ncbi:MAG: 30S ribosomal protein S2 [Candidatus Sungbacteria bacterium]|uniref:Small ribosomal subunit protein uS2 n=1 Tax=Candidatus Sungiibacteriota bacterium TaxID=2750080 RepID=A0A9D6LSI2_9BACT|nr:30S ribosomal protein S2 [Candidatus Sungbacteria bacterium]
MTLAEMDLKSELSPDEEIQTLMKAGVHIGHVKSKTHPAMRPFIFTTRNNVQIIDVLKTKEFLVKAEAFLESVRARGGLILWVGTRPSARVAVEQAAKKTSMPYVTTRWTGGLLTNFRVISKRVQDMEEIERQTRDGELEKYTKQERARINDEYQSLVKVHDGLRLLKKMPDAVIIIDTLQDNLAVNEARKVRIPIVALSDTNTDPNLVTYSIPSNDDARLAVGYMTERLAEAILEGAEEAKRVEALAKAKAEEAKAKVQEELKA